MAHAPRFWIITGIYDNGEEYTPESNLFMSFDAVVDDVFSGQIEDICRVVFVDLLTQSSRNVTRDLMTALAARSCNKREQPIQSVRTMLDRCELTYHDDEAAEHEARAYDRQVRDDYTSHVRGW